MRGPDQTQDGIFSYVPLEERIPADHPLRRLRVVVDGILSSMSPLFSERYSRTGRPSIAPERLLRALLLQILFTIRSERQLVEQIHFNLLFRWFVGLGMDERVWERTVFSVNRERLFTEDLAREFFNRVLHVAEWKGLVSDEHFSVDGSLIEAWAGHKSFVRKDGGSPPAGPGRNPKVDFHGEARSNATHASTTDPQARLYKKSKFTESKLRYITHALSENRNGLVVDVETTLATGTAEREAAITMIDRTIRTEGATVGADKGYDVESFVEALRHRKVKAHVARKTTGSAVDGRTARGKSYAISLRKRKRIEECFGWIKTIGGLRKTRHIGLRRLAGQALLTFAGYNLVRLMNLLTTAPPDGLQTG
jgi:transposase